MATDAPTPDDAVHVGRGGIAVRMGWTDGPARVMINRSIRNHRNGVASRSDMPPPDGYMERSPFWRESTIGEWERNRPHYRSDPEGFRARTKCGELKPIDEFPHAMRRTGRRTADSRCKPCVSANMAARYAANGAAVNRRRRVMAYGITEFELTMMELSQWDTCPICRTVTDQLVIDHDHATGEVRGLLCASCNLGLGAFRDDPQRLLQAALYLKRRHSGFFAEVYRDGVDQLADAAPAERAARECRGDSGVA